MLTAKKLLKESNKIMEHNSKVLIKERFGSEAHFEYLYRKANNLIELKKRNEKIVDLEGKIRNTMPIGESISITQSYTVLQTSYGCFGGGNIESVKIEIAESCPRGANAYMLEKSFPGFEIKSEFLPSSHPLPESQVYMKKTYNMPVKFYKILN